MITNIGMEAFKNLTNTTDVVVFDTRPADEFHASNIPGSINISMYNTHMFANMKSKNVALVGDDTNQNRVMGAHLEMLGFSNIKILGGPISRILHPEPKKVYPAPTAINTKTRKNKPRVKQHTSQEVEVKYRKRRTLSEPNTD